MTVSRTVIFSDQCFSPQWFYPLSGNYLNMHLLHTVYLLTSI